MPSSLRGRLLVATPPLVDPNFDRTVVLVLEHGPEDGAIGIVLNRPTGIDLDDALPDWVRLASEPAVVFGGGPVAPDAVIALARADGTDPFDGWVQVLDDLGTVDVGRDPAALKLEELRVFTGYAGWGPGQLEGEIEKGAWFVVRATPADAFAPDPDDLWRAVLRRQRGRLAMFAHCPEDASVN